MKVECEHCEGKGTFTVYPVWDEFKRKLKPYFDRRNVWESESEIEILSKHLNWIFQRFEEGSSIVIFNRIDKKGNVTIKLVHMEAFLKQMKKTQDRVRKERRFKK
jgi:hypothetical protein